MGNLSNALLAMAGTRIAGCAVSRVSIGAGVADALKAVLPLGIAAALASRQRGRAFVGAVLFLTFSAYSFASELGLYALSRDAQSGGTQAAKQRYEDLKIEKKRLTDRLQALGQTRPT